MSEPQKTGPVGVLSNVKVLEIGQFGAAPMCSMLLGDMGADVIKVEDPDGGEQFRHNQPMYDGWSHYFVSINRNKRSFAVDFKQHKGRDLLRKLVAQMDVLVENMRPGVLDRAGLGHEELLALNPKLIYCSISGFGHTGPLAKQGAYDQIIQGYSGMMALTGHAGQRPAKLAPAVPDIAAAYSATVAILGAYIHRLQSGKGQWIDQGMLDASLYSMALLYLPQLIGYGESPKPLGAAHPVVAPLDAYPTADDSYINTGIVTKEMWGPFCRSIERLDLENDPRFAHMADRVRNRDELDEILFAVFRQRNRDEWVEIMTRGGVPAGPVLDLKEAFAHPQARSREMLLTAPDSVWGSVQSIGHSFKYGSTPNSVRLPAPRLGEHNEEIVRALGLPDAEIAALKQAGVFH